MLAKQHRFHGNAGLRRVYRQGQTVRGPTCTLKFLPTKHHDSYRVAVVVSKKVSKSAVKRNRIRRRLYEAVRRQKEWADTPQDMIFSVFSEQLAIVPSKEIDLLVNTLLRQAKIIR